MSQFNEDFDTVTRNEREIADLQAELAAPVTPTEADPGTFIRKDTLTAKGDLYAATAAASIGRQPVGTNGQVLTADNSTSTGMKWATPSVITPDSGWTAWTGASSKASRDTATATLVNVAEAQKAIIDALIAAGILTA